MPERRQDQSVDRNQALGQRLIDLGLMSRSEVAAMAAAKALAKDPRTHSVHATLITAEGRVQPLWTQRLMPKLEDLQ